MNATTPELIEGVAVLYVDPFGPYPGMVRQWYDETRDARTYDGPWPVVAHPPCGPWGRLKFLCTRQDPAAGPHGVEMVRRWGGVLEHPEHSSLFRHCGLPWPGELADAWGGRTYAVRQVAWGHTCEKRTWLYMVGVAPELVAAGMRTEGRPTHRVTNGSRGDTSLPRANNETNRRSPPAFAAWLIELARSAQHKRSAVDHEGESK